MIRISFITVILSTLIIHSVQPIELTQTAEHYVAASQFIEETGAESATEQTEVNVTSKGVLVRSFRFRPRLNTHLMMLKFRQW